MAVLMVSYVLFGVGLGMVNPAITNSAVAGMPLSQAGVAAAIASTSRQVGAALGVAVAGTVVNTSRAHGTDFARATHPIWWAMAAAGAVVLGAGFVPTRRGRSGVPSRWRGCWGSGFAVSRIHSRRFSGGARETFSPFALPEGELAPWAKYRGLSARFAPSR